ncbi:MAG: hypothetical protein A2X45_05350 [Lentisphaerae bacterium GWF2_50_93]|nr:MAG: hypothetical protein A2X45_05350 [Lentisphaerae bacterium GWF2_50_93]
MALSQIEWVTRLERLNIQCPTRNIQPMKGRKDELIQQSEKINFPAGKRLIELNVIRKHRCG